MKRPVVLILVSVFLLGALSVGGGAYWFFHKPDTRMLPVSFSPDSTPEQRAAMINLWEEQVHEEEFLKKAVTENGWAEKLGVDSTDEAVKELQGRVTVGAGGTPEAPTMNVTIVGKRKQRSLMNEIVTKIAMEKLEQIKTTQKAGH